MQSLQNTKMSLRQQCKQRLKVAFDSIRAVSGSLTFILVVDETALKVISSTIKMMQLVNYGINSIQKLQLKRKKFKNIQAVYLIHPDSYTLLLDDYKVQPQYGIVHILTLTKISIQIMDQLSNNTSLAKRVKTLKQLNFNFILHSDNQFLVQKASTNYTKDSIIGTQLQIQKAINTTVDELASVVTSMSQFYIVQIYYTPASVTNMAQKISFQLKDRLEKMFDLFGKYNVQNYTNSAPQTTFLILDRCYDAITPLMRDFHYLPLLYDLKDVHKHKIQGQGKQKKVYTMDDSQPIFSKYKYQHISHTLSGITNDFQAFSQNHVGAKMEKNQDGNIGLDKMTQVMKKIPQYTQLKDKYSFHMTMSSKIMSNYKQNKYMMMGELQQNLATQTTQNGKAWKSGDLFNQVVKTIGQIQSQQQKARVLTIALLTLDLKPKQKTTLVQLLASCKQNADLYKNMQKISGPLLYKMGPKKNGKDQLILDRHQPKIEQTVKKIMDGGQADLKYLRVGTEGKGKVQKTGNLAPLGRRKIGATVQKTALPRLIVFFCTAISYSEIRALSQYEKDYQVIIGSHSFVTPKQFMSLMNSLSAEQL